MSGQQNEPGGSGGHRGSGSVQQHLSAGANSVFGRSPAPAAGNSFAAPPALAGGTGGFARIVPTSGTIFGPTAPNAATFGSSTGTFGSSRGNGIGFGLAAPQPLQPAVGRGTVFGQAARNHGPFGSSSGTYVAGGFYGMQQPSASRAALLAGSPLPAGFPPVIYQTKRIRPQSRFSSTKGDDDDDDEAEADDDDDDDDDGTERQSGGSVLQVSRKLRNENSKRNQAQNSVSRGDFGSLSRKFGGLILDDHVEPESPVQQRLFSETNQLPRPPASELLSSKSPGYGYYQQTIGSAPTSPYFVHIQTQKTAAPSLVPTLTKPGYSVNPSLEELAKMTEGELATVKGFCVSRPGYGQIEWLGEVDVRAADLDRCVDIDRKVVSVYEVEDAENTKPESGCKLNRPATITFDQVLPKKGTLASVQEKKTFAAKIQEATKKMDAELLSYDPETGVWRFRVQHFSRYAFHEEDPRDGGDGSIQAGKEKETALAIE